MSELGLAAYIGVSQLGTSTGTAIALSMIGGFVMPALWLNYEVIK